MGLKLSTLLFWLVEHGGGRETNCEQDIPRLLYFHFERLLFSNMVTAIF